MKTTTNPSDGLKAALETCEGLTAKLASQKKLLDETNTERHSLTKKIDISDHGQVQRMGHLLTIQAVGNDRRAYLHQELQDALMALRDANARFTGTELRPRCQALESRALAKVEAKLKPHFPDAESRRAAAAHSPELLALAPVQALAIFRDDGLDGAMRQARTLLQAWAAADEFEQKQLS